jgi:hypothetical protein
MHAIINCGTECPLLLTSLAATDCHSAFFLFNSQLQLNISKLCCEQRSVGQSVLVSGTHLRSMTRLLRFSCCGAPSLTRGCICNLFAQLLLGPASSVTLRSMFHRTHYHILQSHLKTPKTWRVRSPYFYLLRNRVAQLYPRALGSRSVASYDSRGYGRLTGFREREREKESGWRR